MSRRFTLAAAVSLLLLPRLATPQNNYYPVGQPTDVDLVMQNGISHSIVVRLINASPYDLEYVGPLSDPTLPGDGIPVSTHRLAPETNRNRNTAKSLFYAPVGVPAFIPGAPTGAPKNSNTTTRPVDMVFTWIDHSDHVDKSIVNWVAKGVKWHDCTSPGCDTTCCGPYASDVQLGLWMTRTAPENADLLSGNYSMILMIAAEVLSMVGVAVNPLDPFAWMGLGVSSADMFSEAWNEQNSTEDASNDGGLGKMYVSAYTIPAPRTNANVAMDCYLSNNNVEEKIDATAPPRQCEPFSAKMFGADDAIDANFASAGGGEAGETLVVTTQVVRGRKYEGGVAASCGGHWGKVPVVTVTVMTETQYTGGYLAAIGQRQLATRMRLPTLDPSAEKIVEELRKLHDKYGQDAVMALASAVADLPPADGPLLRDAVQGVLAGQPLSKEAERVLHHLVVEARQRVK